MEVRINHHGSKRLSTKTFFSDERGFEVAPVMVMGKTDAALLDAQWTLSNAHRVIAEITETGKQLKTIYATHAHPDHYFGLGVIAASFPGVKCIALPDVAGMINRQFLGKLSHWETVIGTTNVCRKTVNIEAMKQNSFELEGERIEILPNIMGDLKYNSAGWIPSIKTLYGSDVRFNEAHPFTCEVTADERARWIRDVKMLGKMGAETVIPGHQKPGMPFDGSNFTFMKNCLYAAEEVIASSQTEGDFYYGMCQKFPEANLFISNEMNAGVFKGGKDWNWREDEVNVGVATKK